MGLRRGDSGYPLAIKLLNMKLLLADLRKAKKALQRRSKSSP